MDAQCCTGGAPISGSLSVTQYQPGNIQLLLTYDYNTLQALFTGRERLNDDSRERRTQTVLLEADYGLPYGFSLGVSFSGVRQERRITNFAGNINETTNTGIADAVLLLKYHFVPKTGGSTYAGLGVGPKIPLGRNDFTDENGILLSADLQPGTNAWDAIFWSYITQTGILRPTSTFSASATYRLTTTGKRNFNQQNYRFGNEFVFRAGISDRILIGKVLLDPILSLRFRTVSADQANGFEFPNTGGTFLFLVPGLGWNATPSLSFQLSGSAPLYRELDGTQITTSYNMSFSVFYTLGQKGIAPNPFF